MLWQTALQMQVAFPGGEMSLQRDPRIRLRGRGKECAALCAYVEAARSGDSRAVVLRGEAGIGKTALLDYVAGHSPGCQVIRAVGIESEMELPFAAVHQLSQPLLDGLEQLPLPQREALETAFGLSPGQPPDRFFVGLALLSQLSGHAEARPVVCLVDDAQWLDRSSAQVLSFIARRLHVESVVIVLAERDGDAPSEFEGLPELRLHGLSNDDAGELVTSATLGPLDKLVRDRIIAEARGNPLALLELPHGRSSVSLAGGFSVPDRMPLPGRIEASYRRRLALLPSATQLLLLVAAADPVGDPNLLWRAASELGVPVEAAAPAAAEDLLEIAARVEFRHPLLRSAIYRAASPTERRSAHRALAAATDPEIDPDRCAWHRAQGSLGPDDDVAAELERSAGRAQARGGLAAAAAFLQRSVALTQEPARRADRALAAAQASLEAGAFDAALGLVAAAEAGPLDDLGRARVDRLHAEVAFAQNRGGEAPLLLLQAARKFETLDVRLSRDTYLDAWAAALFAGRLAGEGGSLLDVSRAVATAPDPLNHPLPCDLLLEGLALVFTDGRPAAVPALRRAVAAFVSGDVSEDEVLRWGWLASRAANLIWDYDRGLEIGMAAVRLARSSGALEALAVVDNASGQAAAAGGDFASATLLAAEVETIKEATGTRIAPHAALALAGIRSREAEASELIAAVTADATVGGQGTAVQYACWANSVLMNGLARYEEALPAAVEASEHTPELHVASWALNELIEAATRTGRAELATDALNRLGEHIETCDTDWALGIHARSFALLSDGDAAESLYREAIDRLSRTQLRPELARAHLLFGEWLRRQRRRVDAREQLRTAHEMLVTIGMEGFAERARRELVATGERVRRPTVETRDRLTAQEAQIAQLATEGLTNPEIGGRLFLSARTVEWHLGKVFAKLGVSSRRELNA
ncbi:AAA family ATPase [Mumia sp. zg.B53]|uniref:helix-turn-helix transcriptional regulator n=1 Tax=unclassified Mumia TaxID=2621872 RepID=UPI001C6F001D|nr:MULTISPECIES: LuxR family transcriptional regulator [unclassified Mumia]MBW9206692.1 AAA family ATPase [Mumia sp. zg.B17]MBW9215585.1 AAA family ATPase [Mumia sp. zg.B53]